MKREIFKSITEDRIMLLDGATGTYLYSHGMPAGTCTEKWVCDHPDVLQKLQREYIAAGSSVIYASTFGANRLRLRTMGLEDEIERFNTLPVQLARQIAAHGSHIVAGDVSMTASDLDFTDEDDFREAVDVFKEQISLLAAAGSEVIVVETMINLKEAEAAVVAAREACDLPVMATISFEANDMTLYGDTPENAAKTLKAAGADAVGANCGAGPDKMLSVIGRMADAVSLPIIAKPNAGVPLPGPNGTVHYNMLADEFAVYMARLIEAGASMVGGCCGTTPEYIEKLASLVQNMSFRSKR